LKKTFHELGIDIHGQRAGQTKTLCPECSASRKKSRDPCLSVNIDEGVYNCHNCGWAGCIEERASPDGDSSSSLKKAPKPPELLTGTPMTTRGSTILNNRGIHDEVLDRNMIADSSPANASLGDQGITLKFPYFKGGEHVNTKYRYEKEGEKKRFSMDPGAEICLYGYDDIKGDTLIWVEGEIDKLSADVAGFENCVSVPSGAGSKLTFLDDPPQSLLDIKVHIIGVDNDAKGEELKTRLIQRLGPAKCKEVNWPENCKDFNEVLMLYGSEMLEGVISSAPYVNIDGVISVESLCGGIFDLYDNGVQGGTPVGFDGLKDLYSVKPGEWTLVSGSPSNGKSEFLDQIQINLARDHGWRFGVCSPENQPIESHVGRLAAKFLELPFKEGPCGRMTRSQLTEAVYWLDEHFTFILPEGDAPTLDLILKRAEDLVLRKGIKGLIIDPWNELDHTRPAYSTETEYISSSLSKVRRFARQRGVHVWIMAHPTKLVKTEAQKYPVVTPYDVSGSAHWYNKADNCISIWRDLTPPEPSEKPNREVQIHVQKIRFRENGKHGVAYLNYDPTVGSYSDI